MILPRKIYGRRGMPREYVARMYWSYVGGLSLARVGEKFGRTRQAVFDAFKVRGLRLRKKRFLPAVQYKGRKYTAQKICGKHRYLRCTADRRERQKRKAAYLHHVVWEEHNGPIPEGYKVCFIDGNHLNCAIENLELLSNSDQPRKHATGANQFTKTAAARLNLLLSRTESGDRSMAVDLKERGA